MILSKRHRVVSSSLTGGRDATRSTELLLLKVERQREEREGRAVSSSSFEFHMGAGPLAPLGGARLGGTFESFGELIIRGKVHAVTRHTNVDENGIFRDAILSM
jgi:hypothetical protein